MQRRHFGFCWLASGCVHAIEMAYETLEPHGRFTIAGNEFAWDFYTRASKLAKDENGNSVISPMLVQYQMVLMAQMASGETRERLVRSMFLAEDKDVTELMWWTLWCYDYFSREVGLSYGTKPRSAMVVARDHDPMYTDGIMEWINHYRTRKSFHVVKTLNGAEKQVNSIMRRLTGAYPREFFPEDLFADGGFNDRTRAVIANKMHFQLFLPSAGCITKVSDHRVPFWRSPKEDGPGEEELQKMRTITVLTKVEYLEDDVCELFGLDLYPGNLIVYYFLPKDTHKDGVLLNVNQALEALEQKLNGQRLHAYMQQLWPQRCNRTSEIMITFPCFKLHTSTNLEKTLRNMGLECLFDPQNKDWTNLFNDSDPAGGDFYLSAVKQSVVVKLLPTSTTSAWALRMGTLNQSMPANWNGRQLTLNRPFLFGIYDRFTRAFLVFGRCQNPCDPGHW